MIRVASANVPVPRAEISKTAPSPTWAVSWLHAGSGELMAEEFFIPSWVKRLRK